MLEIMPASTRVRPESLVRPQRFDLIVKYDLFRALLNGGDRAAEDRYRRHIAARTGGCEGAKQSVDDYVQAATALLKSLQDDGFDPETPIRIGGANGLPLDGAHRIAAALALDLEVLVVEEDGVYGGVWDLEWFRQHGFTREELEQLLSRYAALALAPAVFVFWGPTRGLWPRLSDALSAYLPVAGMLDVRVAPEELPILIDDIYAYRLGPLPNDRIRAKTALLAQGPPHVRVVVADVARAGANAETIVTATKRALRAIAGRDENDFATTLHASDSFDEARYLTELLFNRNYLRHLSERSRAPLRATFEGWLHDYVTALDARDISREDACVVGSAVLEVVGVRTATDIDCIVGRREPRFHEGVVSLATGVDLVTRGYHRRADRARTFSDAEIVANPALHFRVRGLKFANPELVIDRKRQHGRPKDAADVALWSRRHDIVTTPAATGARFVMWTEQQPDVMQFEELQRAAETVERAGGQLVVAGLRDTPVGAHFASVLRPVDLTEFPAHPVATSDDAIAVLSTFGIDVPRVLETVSAAIGAAAHPGITRQRLAACSWIARWMSAWLRDVRPCGILIADRTTLFGHLALDVARHHQIRVHLSFTDVQWTPPSAEAMPIRTACRHANEAIALFQRMAPAEPSVPAHRGEIHALEKALEAAHRRVDTSEAQRRLFAWAFNVRRLALYIWGAGAAGQDVRSWLAECGGCPAGFIDSSSAKIGTSIDGVTIFSPDALRLQDSATRVIVASIYAPEILAQLDRMGMSRDRVTVWPGRDFTTML
jgi:hypothetical protein